MKLAILGTTVLSLTLALPAVADDISDALQRAVDAYAAGDLAKTSEELTFANQQLVALKAKALEVLLPAAPDGWTMTLNPDMAAGLAMIGGGVGVEGNYEGPDGSMKITMMADNPMVASLGAMLATGMAGTLVPVGSVKFAQQDTQLSAMINNRVLITAEGLDPAIMIPILETMDFDAIGAYGS